MRLAGFINAGQDCTAACRVVAGPRVADDVTEALREAAASLVVGDPSDEKTELGPLISAAQRDRVVGFVERAVAGGATVATGGRVADRAGWYYEPSVIGGVSQDDEIVQREVFGPW